MHAVSVSGLKHNPADALRQARSSPVVVLNRDHPDAVLIGLEQGACCRHRGCGRLWPQPYFAMASSRWRVQPVWLRWMWPASSPTSAASPSRQSA